MRRHAEAECKSGYRQPSFFCEFLLCSWLIQSNSLAIVYNVCISSVVYFSRKLNGETLPQVTNKSPCRITKLLEWAVFLRLQYQKMY